MILIDLNQVVISNLMMQLKHDKNREVDEDLIRHMVLNSLRFNIKKFKAKYGEVVVCCDNKHYWRREAFPFYKAGRKEARNATGLDWGLIFDSLDKIRAEIREYLPYKVIDVDGAEADDVIAVLAKRFSETEEVLILSSDKDFVQLQKYGNVTQYSPILKKYISTDDPQAFIKEHIIKGDSGDGIPNFLSPDDSFVLKKRQKPIRAEKLTKWIHMEPDQFLLNETMARGYRRNQMLVDLDFIPQNIQAAILEAYDNSTPGNKNKMLNYFIEKRLKNLIDVLDDF